MPPLTDTELLARLVTAPWDAALPTDEISTALSSPPFISSIPNSYNLRDLGALAPNFVAPGRVFRSGTLDRASIPDLTLLRTQLGVKTIYDFRHIGETIRPAADGDGPPEVVRCPYKDGQDTPTTPALHSFAPLSGGVLGPGYRMMYDDFLEGHTTGFRRVFEGLRDVGKGEAILYHCTGAYHSSRLC